MSMVTRDIFAATLLTAGIASVSFGASLVTPAAGFVVLGVQLAALGATLGFWEGGAEPADPSLSPAVPSWAEPNLDDQDDQDGPLDLLDAPVSTPAPIANPRAPSGPAMVPLANYLGVRSKEEVG